MGSAGRCRREEHRWCKPCEPRICVTYELLCLNDSWWRHQMEIFSALLSICAGNSPVHGEFPTQRPVTRSFDVFFDLRVNKWLNKQSWGWWLKTLSRSLWRHCNGTSGILFGLFRPIAKQYKLSCRLLVCIHDDKWTRASGIWGETCILHEDRT